MTSKIESSHLFSIQIENASEPIEFAEFVEFVYAQIKGYQTMQISIECHIVYGDF